MILAIDVGNTNIIIGVIDAKKTYFVERITTTIGKPNLEYAVALKSILEIYHIAPDQLDGAIVSSVVPPLNRTILAAIRKITGLNAMLVGSGMKTGLNILMDNPKSVGSDMIVNAVGALAEHEPPIIIIEMGTATTMSVIDKNGRYVGGAILPGLRVSLDSMSASTAQLPRISLDTPRHVIGKNTERNRKNAVRTPPVYVSPTPKPALSCCPAPIPVFSETHPAPKAVVPAFEGIPYSDFG